MTNFIDFSLNSSDVIKIIQTLILTINHYIDNKGKVCRKRLHPLFFQLRQSKKIIFEAVCLSENSRQESNTFPWFKRTELLIREEQVYFALAFNMRS